MKGVRDVMTKAMRIVGLSAVGAVLAVGLFPRNGYAQVGAAVETQLPDGTVEGAIPGTMLNGEQDASIVNPTPAGQPYGSSATASVADGVDVAAYGITTVGGGVSFAWTADTITTGAVGGTMRLSVASDYLVSGNYYETPGASSPNLMGQLDIGVARSTTSANPAPGFASEQDFFVGAASWAYAQQDVWDGQLFGGLLANHNGTTPGYDGGTFAGLSDNVTGVGWAPTLDTEFIVAPDSTYFVGMSAFADVGLTVAAGESDVVGIGLDPTWSLSASPGVTYTSSLAIPEGPTIPNAGTAPEPSACALLLSIVVVVPVIRHGRRPLGAA